MAAAANLQLPWGRKHTELWLECFTTLPHNPDTRQSSLAAKSRRDDRRPCSYCSSTTHFPDNCPINPFRTQGSHPLWEDPVLVSTGQSPFHPDLLGPGPSASTTMELDAGANSAPLDTSAIHVRASMPSEIALGHLTSETVCTPLRPLQFKRELVSHPNKDFICQPVSGISQGFKIRYTGPQFNLSSSSASLNPSVIDDTLQKECEAGHLAGPFPFPPLNNFRSCGIVLVPKKDGKWCMIHHFSAPVEQSINDFIDPEAYSLVYPSTDHAAAILICLGHGTLMAKLDLKSAFRQIPYAVHPSDWHLLGLTWREQVYFDKVLLFGLRSSPSLTG